MGVPLPCRVQRRVFAVAVPAALLVAVAGALLLAPGRPAESREAVSSAGFLLAGLTGGGACFYRTRQTSGRRRRSWRLFTLAAAVAVASNVVAALSVGSGPHMLADLGLVAALLLTIAGLVTFPGVRRRGSDQLMAVLDGLVAGGGVIAIASVLVYPQLLANREQLEPAHFAATILIPVLDIVLLTLALILMLRATGSDRPIMLLIAVGFGVYGCADLAYAVLVSQQDFAFGTRLDLGWIAGYLMVSLAALYPSAVPDHPEPGRDSANEARGAVLVLAVLIGAGAVQVLAGDGLTWPMRLLWLVLVVLAGARQTLLASANNALRAGLQHRVDEATADLQWLVRENEQLLASVGDGIYGVDRDGRITFVNPSAARALGLRGQELLGRDAHLTFHTDHEAEDCYVQRVVTTGAGIAEVEDTYDVVGGAPFRVEVTVNPVLATDTDEAPQGVVVVFRDVTQRREVEQMKNEFLSVVSHELRTPLTSIRGSLGLLAGGAVGELEPRAASMVSIAAESSERLTRLINDLLDMERIDSGGSAMRLAAFDAASVVRAAVEQIRGAALPSGVHVEVGGCRGRVLGDQDQIIQTLTNLLGNAIKFSEPGGLVVAGAVVEDGHVRFRVTDEGRGIPLAKLDQIFQPFVQVDSSDAREKGGTGLGLAISRAIVERHGGRIWAESREGKGTTMCFTIPAAGDPARVAEGV